MVKLIVKLTDRVSVEGDGDNVMEAMLAIGGIIESYRAVGVLGENPEDYLPQGRTNTDGNAFFNLVEVNEKNELKLGQRKDGSGIFPNTDKGMLPVWKNENQGSGGGGGGSWSS